MSEQIGPFQLEIDASGVAVATFDRPPVNAVSIVVYEAIAELAGRLEGSDEARVVILAAPDNARAWCGGADLNDFVGMDAAARKQRYARINELLPRLYHLGRPTIAAINTHSIGIGMIMAAMCDMRIGADTATFSCPEIEYGLVAGGHGLLAGLKLPEGKLREMLYTGRRFSAAEMDAAGYLNYVVPREQVLAKAREVAAQIAAKSLPAVKARKHVSKAVEGLGWMDAYLLAQQTSGTLTDGADAGEGVRAFLEHRAPRYVDG